jgi:hypothetical protein
MNGKKVLMAFVLTVVLAVSALPQGAAAADVVKTRGESAFAMFESTDATGCIVTMVTVGGFVDSNGQQAYVYVDRGDVCAGVGLSFIEGITTGAQINVNKELTAGSIVGTWDAYDYFNETTLSVSVNVSWTGNGEMTTTTTRFKERGPTSTVIYHDKGSGRPAIASGSVWDGTTEYLVGSSSLAVLRTTKSGTVTITR